MSHVQGLLILDGKSIVDYCLIEVTRQSIQPNSLCDGIVAMPPYFSFTLLRGIADIVLHLDVCITQESTGMRDNEGKREWQPRSIEYCKREKKDTQLTYLVIQCRTWRIYQVDFDAVILFFPTT